MYHRTLILSSFSILVASVSAGCSSDILDGYLDAGTLADARETYDSPVAPTADAGYREEGLPKDAAEVDAATLMDSGARDTAIDVNMTTLDGSVVSPLADADVDAGLVTASVTATVLALQGGDVPLGSAKLTALKGSVASDKIITLRSSKVAVGAPNAQAIRGQIYSIEPGDTVFDAPIELALPITVPVQEGESAFIAMYDESSKGWIGLPTKWSVSSNEASVLVTRGGMYAVFAGAINPGNIARSCPANVACGGTLLGAFAYASSCTNVPSSSSAQACGTAEADILTSNAIEGNVSFFAGGSYSSNTRGFTRSDVRSNAGCTNFFKNLGDLSCPDLARRVAHSQLYTWSCSGSMSDRCLCTGTIELAGAREEIMGTFTKTDTGLVTLAPRDNGLPKTVEYCAQGNSLTLRDGQGVFTAIKIP